MQPIDHHNMKQKAYILLLTIIFLPVFSFSTCIVIIKTNTEIFVGADSKRIVYAIDQDTGEVKDTIDNAYCKIHKVGKFYFAISGYADSEMLDSAIKACKNYKTLTDIIANYAEMMKASFEHSVEALRTVNNKKYIERFVGNDISAISFFCFLKNKPQLITLYFRTTNSPENETTVTYTKVDNQPVVVLGVHDHIDKLTNQKIVSIFKDGNMINVIKTLIKIEIKNHPNWIGEPIDILKLNQSGELWISRKKNCI